MTGANIGGAQRRNPKPGRHRDQPDAVQGAHRQGRARPTQLTIWHYAGFHNDVQKEIAEEYKAKGDPNVSLEVTAYPNLNDQRTAVKAALAGCQPDRRTSSGSSPALTPSTT